MIEKLKNIKCFLLDQDGTLYLSGHLIEGADKAVAFLRERSRVVFLTNNTSCSRSDYAEKLNGLGIKAELDDIYTAGNATIDYLKSEHKNKKIFLLGTENLKREFLNASINLVEESPDLVVVGFDTTLTYERLAKTCSFIRDGVPYVLTHPDVNCPTKNGYIPDVGSFLALIEKSTGKMPIEVCGKPNMAIAGGIKKKVNLKANEIAMVGDRLTTDMQFAKNNGFLSVLVLSGEATKNDLIKSGMEIDVVLNSIKDII